MIGGVGTDTHLAFVPHFLVIQTVFYDGAVVWLLCGCCEGWCRVLGVLFPVSDTYRLWLCIRSAIPRPSRMPSRSWY